MKTLKSMAMICLLMVTFATVAQNSKDKEIMKDAEMAKTKLLKADAGLQHYFDNSSGYVIFPNVGEGGLIIGGASGNGVLYENGKAMGMADLKKLDIGAQAGGQSKIQVIFFETEDALNEFKTGDYAFSAEVSAIAVEEGKAKNANYDEGVVVFALPKAGLMADASVGGQKFSYKAF